MVDYARAAIRGGNFNNTTNAGAFYLNLNNAPSNANNNIGFRAATIHEFRPTDGPACRLRPQCGEMLESWPLPEGKKLKNGAAPPVAFATETRRLVYANAETAAMAKTYNHLYPRIYDFDNLHQAYLKARRNKRYRREVLEFSANLEEQLIDLQNRLVWKTYRTGPYKYFNVYEPKERMIAALPFIDRVAQHALCSVIEPIFERSFIYDSYACRPRRGLHQGVDRTTDFLRRARRKWGRVYCLKGDIRKYFPSIDHDVLKNIIRRRIACPDTLAMIDEIIDHSGDVGIPIGNLTSQLFANVYLDQLDHFVKDDLREAYYIRYMDDFCLLDGDKRRLHELLAEIDGYLINVLHLEMNGKTQVFPVGPAAIDFLGYRIRPDVRLLRKQNVRRMRRRLKKLARQARAGIIGWEAFRPHLASWMGHCRYADSYRIRNSVMRSAGILAEAV
jgi:retron-type reverse transcriptase